MNFQTVIPDLNPSDSKGGGGAGVESTPKGFLNPPMVKPFQLTYLAKGEGGWLPPPLLKS